MILVSACLAGVNCRYDGGNNLIPRVQELVERGNAIPVCPEQLGGDPTPREPVEINGLSGDDVLDGKAKPITKSGLDKTESFVTGAKQVLDTARTVGAKYAILKERSPSCGCHMIYDGTFTGSVKRGRGVTAALLEREGIPIYSEDDIDNILD